MAKATHSGHCQACGHLQKLPSGMLAKHGYKVAHGFFSGICVGTGCLPFEQSFALILDFIEAAKSQLKTVESTQATLRGEPTSDTKMWKQIYYPGKGMVRSHTDWEEVTLRAFYQPYEHEPSRGSIQYRYTDKTGREHGHYTQGFRGIQSYDLRAEATVEECRLATVREYNEQRADWLEYETKSLHRYIVWQEERVRTWKPGALLPVTAKDKEGFEPVKPAY